MSLVKTASLAALLAALSLASVEACDYSMKQDTTADAAQPAAEASGAAPTVAAAVPVEAPAVPSPALTAEAKVVPTQPPTKSN